MQPRTLAILITLLPLFAVNAAYLQSAWQQHVSWCFPYVHGCTTISQAGRSGDTIFMFRALMMTQAVLLACFWLSVKHWLELLNQQQTTSAKTICWLGFIGALFLLLYIDFLGTEGEISRFMRRYGVIIYFTFTPLAQLLLLRHLFRLKAASPALSISRRVLNYQLAILLLILLTGFTSLAINYGGYKTYQSENIIEWNFSLLITLYFAGYIVLWNRLECKLQGT